LLVILKNHVFIKGDIVKYMEIRKTIFVCFNRDGISR